MLKIPFNFNNMFLKTCLIINILYIVRAAVVDEEVLSAPNTKNLYDLNKAEELFREFVEKYQKRYKDEEEYNYRLKVFTQNLKDINENNMKIDDEDDEVFGINEFADLTYEEFVKEHTGLPDEKFLKNITREGLSSFPMSAAPDQWDWRSQNVVDASRNQGGCGSCWAFSAVGAIYGQIAKKYKNKVRLSVQQFLDCFHQGGACSGDFPDRAFRYAAQAGGVMSEADYPYKGKKGKCRFNKDRVVAKVSGGRRVNVQDEEYLKQLVYNYGPVSIGMYASHGLQLHKDRIATASTLGCTPRHAINHAVVLVGYGTEHGHPYWLIQNSFGANWGEQGFFKLERGINACNILTYVATVDVV